jgi:hypothetical protein
MSNNGMVGEILWVKLKGRPVQMVVIESHLVFEPNRKGFDLVLRRPKGIISYEAFYPMGANGQIEENVRESASQVRDMNRSLRGF